MARRKSYPLTHGRSAYLSKRCRCDVCREATRVASERLRRAKGVPVSTDRPWTSEDVSALAEDVPSRVLAQRLGRTVGAVDRKRAVLGLGRRQRGLIDPVRPVRPWETSEVLLLASELTSQAIADRLGRSYRAVATMRNNLGLGRGSRGKRGLAQEDGNA